ncbi:MAG: hypothetical protein OHK0039_21810 [Bacteroidia bacterium]
MLVTAPGDSTLRPIGIDRLAVQVQVIGNLARTTLDFTLHNPYDRQLEGQLFFPLAAGQTVSRFALEIDGHLREGVVVDKTQGRQVFESVMRRKIDPGLLEWVAGNNFRARIYPIPAGGYKRFVVAYEEVLARDGDDWLSYRLPLSFGQPLPHLHLRAEVLRPGPAPILDETPLPGLDFLPWQQAYLAERSYEDVRLDGQLRFRLPEPATPTLYTDETGTYFCTVLRPETFRKHIPTPRRICLLWDVSHSMNRRDADRELDLLGQLFGTLRDAEVLLVPFHQWPEASERYRIADGRWDSLATRLRALPCDGATRLDVIDFGAYPDCDLTLLATDGLSTLGESLPRGNPRHLRIVSSSPAADHALLAALADRLGGSYHPLHAGDMQATAALLLSAPPYLRELRYTALAEVYPRQVQAVSSDLVVAGKWMADTATLVLGLGHGLHATQTTVLRLDKAQAQPGGELVRRIWAQQKLADLLHSLPPQPDSIRSLGRQYGLVTPGTSLLVLDRVEDYVEFGIVPPPELRAVYDDLLAQRKERRRVELLTQLDQVAEEYHERQTWWQTDFDVPAHPFTPDPVREEERAATDGDADWSAEVSSFESLTEVAKPEADPAEAEFVLLAWNPQTPYLDTLGALPPAQRYPAYLHLKQRYGAMPAFYVDVAELWLRAGDTLTALRVLSNLAELELENPDFLRTLGRRLEELGQHAAAATVFGRVLALRDDEPQSHRDLALCLARLGRHQAAVDLLYAAIQRSWPDRFRGIGALMTHEMNRIIADSPVPPDVSAIDDRLLAHLPVGLRVLLDWDANDIDMDLWVTDPRGERCYYQHTRTEIGGRMSSDFTGGYGPEEFLLRSPMPGTYRVQVNYYGDNRQQIPAPVQVRVQLFRDYGLPRARERSIMLRLGQEREVLDAAQIVVE